MSQTYIFESGKHKGKEIQWVKKNDLSYLKGIVKKKIRIKLSPKIKDFITKLVEENTERASSAVIDEVIEIYREGGKRGEIFDMLVQQRGYTTDYSNFILDGASNKIKQTFEEEKSYLIGLHLKRYDSSHDKHMANAETLIGPKKKWKRIEQYVLAMDSLIAKERLLGLHSKKYNIQLNNFINRDASVSTESGYNFEALTTEELVELSQLMAEAKLTGGDGQEIELFNEEMLQTGTIIQDIIEEAEEVEYEEVESPLAKVKHSDIFGDKKQEKKKKQGNTIDLVEEKIRKSNKTAFELIMEKQKKGKS